MSLEYINSHFHCVLIHERINSTLTVASIIVHYFFTSMADKYMNYNFHRLTLHELLLSWLNSTLKGSIPSILVVLFTS